MVSHTGRGDLDDFPFIRGYFDRLEGGSFVQPAAVPACDGGKVVDDRVCGEHAELELVACHVQEGGVGSEDLAEDGVEEAGDARARDADEGEGDGEDLDDVAGHDALRRLTRRK